MKEHWEISSEKSKKRLYLIVFLLLLVCAAVLRLFRLDSVPYGVHYDEAAMSYNAYSIVHYQTDGYGTPYPLYLQNIGGSQSPLPTYLTALFFRLFGRSVFTLRLTVALLGILTVCFGMLIAKELLGRRASLICGVLITICPYFIMQSRFSYDCNSMLGVMTIAFYALLQAVKRKRTGFYILGGVLMALVLYTYGLSFFVVPVFVLPAFVYLLYTRQLDRKGAFSYGIPLFLAAVPCILFALITAFDLPPVNLPGLTIKAMSGSRASLLGADNIPFNFVKNWKCILFHDEYPLNADAKYLTMYVVSIPFFIVGFIRSIGITVRSLKTRVYSGTALVLCWFLAEFILGLFCGKLEASIHRLNAIFFPAVYFVTLGIVTALKRIRATGWRHALAAALAVSYGALFLLFGWSYYRMFSIEVNYPADYSPVDYRKAYDFMIDNGIYADCYRDQDYIFYYGLHDDIPPVYYMDKRIAESPARIHAYVYEAGKTEIPERGACFVFNYRNYDGLDAFFASENARYYEELDFDRYRFFYQPADMRAPS